MSSRTRWRRRPPATGGICAARWRSSRSIKGVDCLWRTGWVSDRAAAFLATGRPVITEDAAVGRHLPPESGFMEIRTLEEAREAIERTLRDWPTLSRQARACAEECFEGDARDDTAREMLWTERSRPVASKIG